MPGCFGPRGARHTRYGCIHTEVVILYRQFNRSTGFNFMASEQPTDLFTELERRKTFLTVEELADILNVSTKSVYRMTKKGILPHMKIGTQIRLEAATTARWLRGRAA